jgi:peptide/nickel transport system substrate-binding protein
LAEEEAEAEEEEAEAEEAAADSDDPRGTLRIAHPVAWGGAENLDPVDASRFDIIMIIYDRLARLGDDGRPTPSIATSWESNDKADQWTFNLRDGFGTGIYGRT